MAGCPFSGATRRGVLGAAAFGLAGAALVRAPDARAQDSRVGPMPGPEPVREPDREPLSFFGPHQNGITRSRQAHTYFAAFDIVSDKREEIAALLKRWTDASARLCAGQPAVDGPADPDQPPGDSGEAAGLEGARLTLTFGFGPGLFTKDGKDRFGLARNRPEAFVDLPRFPGDQLVPERTGGDLSVQACADDPQATMHAVRQLIRLAYGVAQIRWVQSGFLPGSAGNLTPRNLMGFKDGSFNVDSKQDAAMDAHVWVGEEGGAWMQGGTYLVARPIRMALEHWDRMKLSFQEETIGRRKADGAFPGTQREFGPIPLDDQDKDGNPLIAENAHVRLAAPQANGGAEILRRAYSYDNGVSMTAERWPPWRQALELDAGLLFICYQRDPRAGFIRIFEKMSRFDMLNQFVTHVGGGLFAIPAGVQPGRYIGQALFEA